MPELLMSLMILGRPISSSSSSSSSTNFGGIVNHCLEGSKPPSWWKKTKKKKTLGTSLFFLHELSSHLLSCRPQKGRGGGGGRGGGRGEGGLQNFRHHSRLKGEKKKKRREGGRRIFWGWGEGRMGSRSEWKSKFCGFFLPYCLQYSCSGAHTLSKLALNLQGDQE